MTVPSIEPSGAGPIHAMRDHIFGASVFPGQHIPSEYADKPKMHRSKKPTKINQDGQNAEPHPVSST
jgi:hypothetical protein